MPLDENEAWERMRAAILRCHAEPTEENHAEVRRTGRVLLAAMTGDGAEDRPLENKPSAMTAEAPARHRQSENNGDVSPAPLAGIQSRPRSLGIR